MRFAIRSPETSTELASPSQCSVFSPREGMNGRPGGCWGREIKKDSEAALL